MDIAELVQLGLRLCASNAAMMSAWFLLVPIPIGVWFAVFASHGLASAEYAIQVPANATAHEKKLGLISMRAPQEVIMFVAFVAICLLAGQAVHAQQLLALPLIALVAVLIVRPHIGHVRLSLVLTGVLVACIAVVYFFHFPHIVLPVHNHLLQWDLWAKMSLGLLATAFVAVSSLLVRFVYGPALRQNSVSAQAHPLLFDVLLELLLCGIACLFVLLLSLDVTSPALLLLLIVALCFVPNSFMIIAWYGHTQIKPRGVFAHRPKLYKYLVAWGTAFLEYAFLVPLLRFAYQYLGIFQLFGLMELSTISVFLCFTYIVSKRPDEHTLERRHVALYCSLIIIEIAFCLLG